MSVVAALGDASGVEARAREQNPLAAAAFADGAVHAPMLFQRAAVDFEAGGRIRRQLQFGQTHDDYGSGNFFQKSWTGTVLHVECLQLRWYYTKLTAEIYFTVLTKIFLMYREF